MELLCYKAPMLDAELVTKGTEAYNLILKQYPMSYTLSEKRRTVYYEQIHVYDKWIDPTGGLPKKYEKGLINGMFEWRPKVVNKKERRILYDKKHDCFVVKNARTAGTPRIVKINGQDFWSSGESQQWNRQKLKDYLLDYFTPRVRQQLPESIWPPKGSFIHFEYIFYFPFSLYEATDIQDIDNHHFPYTKVFKDTLQILQVIKGDDYRYVRGDYSRYVEVFTEEERRIEIKIHFVTNENPILPRLYTVANKPKPGGSDFDIGHYRDTNSNLEPW